MIDIENLVISKVDDKVFNNHNIHVLNGYFNTISSFPFVGCIETENVINTKGIDTSGCENLVNLSYEFNIYDNDKINRKQKVKSILNTIDDEMLSLGFVRTFCKQTPNIDTTVFRITTRYTAVATKGVLKSNGNTVYTILKR